MPIVRFNEWGAYFDIERTNYTQMEVNIARIARDLHNKTYTNKVELGDFLELKKTAKQDSQKEISIKLKTLNNMIKMTGK